MRLQHEAVSYGIGVYEISRGGALRVDAGWGGSLVRARTCVRSIKRCDGAIQGPLEAVKAEIGVLVISRNCSRRINVLGGSVDAVGRIKRNDHAVGKTRIAVTLDSVPIIPCNDARHVDAGSFGMDTPRRIELRDPAAGGPQEAMRNRHDIVVKPRDRTRRVDAFRVGEHGGGGGEWAW